MNYQSYDHLGFRITLFLVSMIIIFPSVLTVSGRLCGIIIGGVSGNPFWVLSIEDPVLSLDAYPISHDLTIKEKRKLDRVYYPRTRESLLDYDIMVFHAAHIEHFIPRQVNDLDYAFREGFMAAFSGLTGLGLGWEDPVLLDVIPIHERSVSPYFRAYRVEFKENRDPVFTSFQDYGIENFQGNQYTEMYVKQGATVWGDIIPYDLPWLVSWRPGGGNPGMLWNVAHIFDDWWSEKNNPYALDVATNMIFYSIEKELINNIPARREARLLFRNTRVQMSLIISMLNWADSFGATIAPLEEHLIGLEKELGKAEDDYLEQDYEQTISFLKSFYSEVESTTTEAVRLKNQALRWVYIIEWSTVTGTLTGSGFVLWTIMVKRRGFKEVRTTKLINLSL